MSTCFLWFLGFFNSTEPCQKPLHGWKHAKCVECFDKRMQMAREAGGKYYFDSCLPITVTKPAKKLGNISPKAGSTQTIFRIMYSVQFRKRSRPTKSLFFRLNPWAVMSQCPIFQQMADDMSIVKRARDKILGQKLTIDKISKQYSLFNYFCLNYNL